MMSILKQDIQTIKDDVKEIKELLKELQSAKATVNQTKKGTKNEGN